MVSGRSLKTISPECLAIAHVTKTVRKGTQRMHENEWHCKPVREVRLRLICCRACDVKQQEIQKHGVNGSESRDRGLQFRYRSPIRFPLNRVYCKSELVTANLLPRTCYEMQSGPVIIGFRPIAPVSSLRVSSFARPRAGNRAVQTNTKTTVDWAVLEHIL